VEALVRSYGDDRLVYRHNGGNIGPLANAMAAFAAARGTYVAMLHDDDLWEPGFLAALVPPLEADPSLTLAFCDHWVIDDDDVADVEGTAENTRRWRRHDLSPGAHRPFADLALVDRAVPVAMGTVLRKAAIDWDDVPEEIGSIYDIWLAYLACRDGGGAYYVPERLTRYRHHSGAITSSTRYDRRFVYCYDRFLGDDRLRGIEGALRREAAGFRTGLGISLLADGDRRAARRQLGRAVADGRDLRALATLGVSVLPGRPLDHVERARQLRRRLRPGTTVRV
jgi:glycosyltransferase involved in cell wall biosynthesis